VSILNWGQDTFYHMLGSVWLCTKFGKSCLFLTLGKSYLYLTLGRRYPHLEMETRYLHLKLRRRWYNFLTPAPKSVEVGVKCKK